MSNNTNEQDISVFKFLGSQEFIKELKERDLPPEEHNLLLSAHLLAIGFNTSGINEGSMRVGYFIRASENEKFCRTESNFAFYTTKNGLIEESNYFNRQSIKFNHPLFYFRDTRGFRDFCIEYFNKHSKIIDSDYPITKSVNIKDTNIKFRLNGRKRKSEEGQLYGYQSIICANPNVKSLLEAFILEKELSANNQIKQKTLKL
jgi:hypothetical protein